MRIVILGFVLLLCACATQPVSVFEASPVPQSRLLAPQWSSPAPNTGRLIITRDRGFTGAGCTFRVLVDGIPAADIAPSEKVELFLSPGEHVVSAMVLGAMPYGICGGGTSEAYVIVAAAKEKILRVGVTQSMDLQLQPSGL